MTIRKADKIIYNESLKQYYDIDNNQYLCKKCKHNIRSKREEHYQSCRGNGIRRDKQTSILQIEHYSELCDMGCGQKSQFYYKTGKAYCSKLASKCPIKVQKDSEAKKGINPFEGKIHPRGFLGKEAWNKGLTQETSERVKKNGEAIKESFIIYGDQRKKTHHTKESKEKIRQNLIERYASGWQATSCGRAKSYPYENPSEGLVNLTGTWEVDFAKALDQAAIQWVRNKKRFDYIKPDGKDATYLPDFYIPKYNTYIETKGYETDLDRSKWEQFHEPLIVLRKVEIFQIKKWLKDNVEINESMMIKLCKF